MIRWSKRSICETIQTLREADESQPPNYSTQSVEQKVDRKMKSWLEEIHITDIYLLKKPLKWH